ncbi:glutaredoxin [Exidia glandulosa HHB12029]|uniref:Monothiol glutaredoxin-5, mitochondrial n=1 Tax=Exidia glandulosa HHB12029 TaxID=1314781 RepID=A0A165HIP2_EXIGL|nr:glutaredoxin [Exidia glandulosa HHB12029]
MFSRALQSSTRRAVLRPARVAPGMVLRRLLSDDIRQKLDTAVHAHPLVLFMKGEPAAPQCGFSRAVVQILDIHGVPESKMQTYDVLQDQQLRESIKEFSQWPTIPQLYVNGEFVGGCDIVLEMHQNGKLEELLEKNNIIEPVAAEAAAPSSA